MRLDNFDLNLLVALDALVAERNVTRAAQRLRLTQSAMSAALGRLRQALGDPILVQHGKTMVPTHYAQALAPEVASAIAGLRRLIQPSAGFDATSSGRVFRIAASDYITTVLLAPLLKTLEQEAPGVRLEISLPSDDTARRLAEEQLGRVSRVDELLGREQQIEIADGERHVVVGCRHNPLLAQPLTLKGFGAAGHVAVRIDGRNTYIERELDRLGLVRRVEVHAPSFVQAPFLLPGTRRIALMHERLARMTAPALDLTVAEPPFDLPVMHEMMQFHATRRADEGLIWLRDRLRALAGFDQR